MLIKRFFKDEELLQWIFETFLKSYRFSQKSGNDAYITGWGSCYLSHYDALHTKIDMRFIPNHKENFTLQTS